MDEIIDYLETWVSQLHNNLLRLQDPEPQQIWEAYVDLSIHTLLPWDKEYLQRMPERRQDGSIFLSIASYRDEKCVATLEQAFEKATYPEKLFVGLVQQNCLNDCQTGVMEDGLTHPTNPDPDCFDTFCQSETGHEHCKAGHLRVLRMREPESLGPYMARYLASKLWYGEELYIQMDSHMTFTQGWDAITWDGVKNAPSEKPVISHYPPSHKFDLKLFESFASSRICGPMFTGKTIRLEGSQVNFHAFRSSRSGLRFKIFPANPFPPESDLGRSKDINSALCASPWSWLSCRPVIIFAGRSVRSFASLDLQWRRNFNLVSPLDFGIRLLLACAGCSWTHLRPAASTKVLGVPPPCL